MEILPAGLFGTNCKSLTSLDGPLSRISFTYRSGSGQHEVEASYVLNDKSQYFKYFRHKFVPFDKRRAFFCSCC
jgi:hypothetical protein